MASREIALEQLAPWLKSLEQGVERVRWDRAFKVIPLLLVSSTKKNFDLGRSPDGTPWLPLKNPGPKRGANPKPLRDKGILAASLSARGQGHVERSDPASGLLEWGTNLDYAGVHQDGATIHYPEKRRVKPWVWQTRDGVTVFTRKIKAHTVTIPARPFLGLNEEVIGQITEFLTDEFQERLIGPVRQG